MNKKSINHSAKLSILSLAILSSFGAVQAGSVTSTFATGDTLTATKMTEIRTAVNDNDTKVSANTLSISNLFGGDGSAGDLTISANTSWATTAPANTNFANCTIDASFQLTVLAGTTIRCSGTFTNNGTLQVLGGAISRGTSFNTSGSGSSGASMTTHPGDTRAAATPGMFDDDAIVDPATLQGGVGGSPLLIDEVRVSTFDRYKIGGGSGSGPFNSIRGGGLVKIYAQGAIVNAGTITANGDSTGTAAHAGGGGGIVILASRTSVDNSGGTISVTGGGGGASNGAWGGNGGGGGGGIIIMASPTTPVLGTETVTGGTAGTASTTLTNEVRTAGGGGGAGGGTGGNGGQVISTGAASVAADGSAGFVVTLEIDPFWLAL